MGCRREREREREREKERVERRGRRKKRKRFKGKDDFKSRCYLVESKTLINSSHYELRTYKQYYSVLHRNQVYGIDKQRSEMPIYQS